MTGSRRVSACVVVVLIVAVVVALGRLGSPQPHHAFLPGNSIEARSVVCSRLWSIRCAAWAGGAVDQWSRYRRGCVVVGWCRRARHTCACVRLFLRVWESCHMCCNPGSEDAAMQLRHQWFNHVGIINDVITPWIKYLSVSMTSYSSALDMINIIR